jgi:ATP:ADP antiporter, AAA family
MKISNIRSDERRALILFSLIMLVNMLTLEGSFVVSTSGFLETIGPKQLPLLWIIDMVLVLLGTTAIAAVIDRWPRKQLLGWILFGLAFFFLFIRTLFAYGIPTWGAYPFLYMIAEQQLMVIPIVFWAMANDIFNIQQTKRFFPLIAAAGVIGGVVGNILAVGMANFFSARGQESYEILVINALLLLILFVVYQVLSKDVQSTARQAQEGDTLREMLADGWDFVRNVEVFRYLAIAMLGVGFALTVVELNFLDVLNNYFSGAEFQTFYGLFRIVQTITIVLVQAILASRLLNLLELKRIFLILPIFCIMIILAAFALPGIYAIAVGRLVGRTILFGIDEPSRKSLQGLIPDEKRGRVSSFLDGYLYAAGTILASALLMLLFWGTKVGWLPADISTWIYLGIGGLVSLVSIWAIRKFWISFDTSMLDWRLARRKRRSSILDLDF